VLALRLHGDAAPPRLLVLDGERDEVHRSGGHLRLALAGSLEHEHGAADVEPHAAPRVVPPHDAKAEDLRVEMLEPREIVRAQSDVVNPHTPMLIRPAVPRVVVATHGHCFDGLCSAVMFTHLYRHRFGNDGATFAYHAAGYGPGQNGVDPKVLAGDVNAILDFRFSPLSQLAWYFDHHVSAFVTPEDRAYYEKRAAEGEASGERQFFHDGAYSSATKLIADVGLQRFGLDPSPTAELVRWADMIDSAAFPSAKMAVDRAEPELRLMTVVEHLGDDAFLGKMVPRLLAQPLSEVARSADVTQAYEPLGRGHEAFVKLVGERATATGPVVLVDVSDQIIDVAGKFVTYALYPQSAYSVIVSRSKSKCKISIGYNPWSPLPRTHNIAAICERYGGGGHPVVGAISLPADQVEQARALARSITGELAS
jgi:hypothetical protein